MDERQTKIVEGAGLEDSRINREFIDTLQKWSTPALLVILLLAGGYWLVNFLEQQRVQNLDAAFASYSEAELERRPERLLEVADEHSGNGAVSSLATLTAADLHLQGYHLRTRPGTLGTGEDRLDDAGVAGVLAEAGELYARVYNENRGKDGRELFTIGGRWGMVAVALSQGRFDEAESGLDEIVGIAEEQGFDGLADDARELKASIPELRTQRELVVVEPEPAEEEPAPAPAPVEPVDLSPEGDAEGG